MEHNVEVKWAALVEPLGFQRGFVRTEIAPWSGRTMAADAEAPVRKPILAPDLALAWIGRWYSYLTRHNA